MRRVQAQAAQRLVDRDPLLLQAEDQGCDVVQVVGEQRGLVAVQGHFQMLPRTEPQAARG